MNVTWYVISNIEINYSRTKKYELCDKARTTHCLGCIPGIGDWQAVYSHPFLQDGEVVGLCRAFDINPQFKIVLVEE
jgi:hypothetical protein